VRLIFVTGSFSTGGAERHAVALLNRLAKRGHECHAVSVKTAGDADGRIRARDGVSVHTLDAGRYLDLRAVADLGELVSRAWPSALVAANAYALMYAWLASRIWRVRVPLAVVYHSNRLLGIKEELQMLLYRPLFRTADCSVFVSENQRRYWASRGVFSRRSAVIHNGVDIEEFRDRQSIGERRAVRAGLGFSDSDYVIGLPALLRPEKNPVQLVDAVAALRRRRIPAKALFIGDGDMREAIRSRARVHGLEGSVVVTGLKRDVRPCVAACDAATLCSLTETFSLAAIEAMAMGKPVVQSDVGGAAEMIVPGRNGFLFPVGDTRAYTDRLAMLADREVSVRMGREARATVEARFSEETMVDRYEQLLLDLCRTHAAVHPEYARRFKATH
jgi:glycosyltransferase involved in cell wall biosynthesis